MTEPRPTGLRKVETWAANRSAIDDRVVALVVNFGTAAHTARCLHSLGACDPPPASIYVLDNGSPQGDFEALHRACRSLPASELTLFRTDRNLGFAAGTELLISAALQQGGRGDLLLLNSDAVADPGLVARLRGALDVDPGRIGLAGGRMHRLDARDRVDTLGIALYRSLMPADRKSTDDRFFGPTGGCCLLARDLVDAVMRRWGYVFDARYFCYCEDTDLVVRARLLGFEPAYVDERVALHEGQASSRDAGRDFIAYHGIRNSIWMHAKLMPAPVLWRYGALLVLAHVLNIGRHLLAGRVRLMWRTYRDALARLPEFVAERNLLPSGPGGSDAVRRALSPRFYRRGYLRDLMNR